MHVVHFMKCTTFAFLGSSSPMRAQAMMMAANSGAVLHMCAGVCQVQAHARPVVHVTVARQRQPQDLTETWITPPGAFWT